jgi:hypothetical protein
MDILSFIIIEDFFLYSQARKSGQRDRNPIFNIEGVSNESE